MLFRSQFELMSKNEITKIQETKETNPVWKSHWGEMAKKTVLRRLFKTLPMSVELASLIAIEDAGLDHENDVVEAIEKAEALDFATDGTNEIVPVEPEITEAQRDELLQLVMGSTLNVRNRFHEKYKTVDAVPAKHFANVVAAMKKAQAVQS